MSCGPEEDTSGNFKHGGWSFKFSDDQIPKYKQDELNASDALLLGRKTYEIFAGYWPKAKDDEVFADKMNNLSKHVVSTTLKKVDWNKSRLIKTDVPEEVGALRQQRGKDVLVYGSGKLVKTLKAIQEANNPIFRGFASRKKANREVFPPA